MRVSTMLMAGFVVVMPPCAVAQEWSLDSPDGRTTIEVMRNRDGSLMWRAEREGHTAVEYSALGIRRQDQSFVTGLKFVSITEPRTIDEKYETPHGKRRAHHVRGREQTLTFANPTGARVEIILRAHDDGAAFRYRFPETDKSTKTVVEEVTTFAMHPKSTAWLSPQQQVHRYGPAYEEYYEEVVAGTPAPQPDGWAFPALFRTPSPRWVLITESGYDGTYVGTHLKQQSEGGKYHLAFPDPKEGMGVGKVQPSSSLPWTMPWRVVIIRSSAAGILESDLVTDLSPPTRLKDASWIKPGRAAWSWWSESESPKHAARLNAFTDLAAEMGWEYALVDANWNLMETGAIEDVIAHARAKNVGLLLWYNSGGPHNDVSEAPRDRMHQRQVRRAEFKKIRDWGIKGVKVDFWHSDKQDRYQQYRELLEDAAEFQLMVNFHGSTIPRGWEREFPHLIGMEGVFGGEQYKFRETFTKRAPSHNTILPFTRNVIGVMDYTPVLFTDHKFPRTTTNAHELAQAVVFVTGIQHFADSVTAYRALPAEPKAFLRDVPSAWDETRALSGEPGKSVVVARRSGKTWYVGGLNAETAQKARVDLTFLGAGEWKMMLINDGDADRSFASSTRTVIAKDVIDVSMRARGGFVMQITQ